MELMTNIDISKSSAIEYIGSRVLKDCFEVLTLQLTQLYNECLTQRQFLENWGLGFVTPVLKVTVQYKGPKIGDPS